METARRSRIALLELGLALLSDLRGRTTALLDSLLGDLFPSEISVRLMRQMVPSPSMQRASLLLLVLR